MSEKRQDPIFWVNNYCPSCGHFHSIIYTPDLLKGPTACVCTSPDNPCARDCFASWDFGCTQEQALGIQEKMIIADDLEEMYQIIKKKRLQLGHKED